MVDIFKRNLEDKGTVLMEGNRRYRSFRAVPNSTRLKSARRGAQLPTRTSTYTSWKKTAEVDADVACVATVLQAKELRIASLRSFGFRDTPFLRQGFGLEDEVFARLWLGVELAEVGSRFPAVALKKGKSLNLSKINAQNRSIRVLKDRLVWFKIYLTPFIADDVGPISRI